VTTVEEVQARRRARVDAIRVQVAEVDVRLVILNAVAALLMLIGRLPAYLVNALVWCAIATRQGYREARSSATLREQE
jgi:hypothetical protein